MKILIVGGGIAGPAFAGQLKKHNINCEITLIEQAPEFKNIGFGITLWGNGRKILKEVGIDQSVIEREGYEIPWESIENIKHQFVQGFYFDVFRKFGPVITIPRTVLHKTLVDKIDPSIIKLNTKISRIINNNSHGVEVELTDGSINKYDLLVAGDGIHSWTRENVFGKGFVKSYGWSLWLCWVSEQFKVANGLVAIANEGKSVSLAPLKDRAEMILTNRQEIGAFDDPSTRKERLVELFKNFGSTVTDIIKAVPSGNDILYSETAYIVMDRWSKGSVVLIGDAQHALSPIIGMGASLALEDACVLAQELSKETNIQVALEKFSERRSPRIKKYQKEIMLVEDWIMAKGVKASLRDKFLHFISPKLLESSLVKLMNEEM